MQLRELGVPGAFEVTPRQHRDERGTFLEYYRSQSLAEAIGHPLDLAQANCSVSARGVLRGLHFADVPPGQAKYVTCPSGAVLDVAVDLREGSPTFGRWDSVLLDDVDRRAIYLAEGLGHAFMALTDQAVVTYLCSTSYTPGRERGIDPLDPQLGIVWPADVTPVLSPKDAEAVSLARASEDGLLPSYRECLAHAEDVGRRDGA